MRQISALIDYVELFENDSTSKDKALSAIACLITDIETCKLSKGSDLSRWNALKVRMHRVKIKNIEDDLPVTNTESRVDYLQMSLEELMLERKNTAHNPLLEQAYRIRKAALARVEKQLKYMEADGSANLKKIVKDQKLNLLRTDEVKRAGSAAFSGVDRGSLSSEGKALRLELQRREEIQRRFDAKLGKLFETIFSGSEKERDDAWEILQGFHFRGSLSLCSDEVLVSIRYHIEASKNDEEQKATKLLDLEIIDRKLGFPQEVILLKGMNNLSASSPEKKLDYIIKKGRFGKFPLRAGYLKSRSCCLKPLMDLMQKDPRFEEFNNYLLSVKPEQELIETARYFALMHAKGEYIPASQYFKMPFGGPEEVSLCYRGAKESDSSLVWAIHTKNENSGKQGKTLGRAIYIAYMIVFVGSRPSSDFNEKLKKVISENTDQSTKRKEVLWYLNMVDEGSRGKDFFSFQSEITEKMYDELLIESMPQSEEGLESLCEKLGIHISVLDFSGSSQSIGSYGNLSTPKLCLIKDAEGKYEPVLGNSDPKITEFFLTNE